MNGGEASSLFVLPFPFAFELTGSSTSMPSVTSASEPALLRDAPALPRSFEVFFAFDLLGHGIECAWVAQVELTTEEDGRNRL